MIDGPSWAAGKFGGGVSFDGSDDYIEVAFDPVFDLSGDLTLAAWVHPTSFAGDLRRILSLPQNAAVNGAEQYALVVSATGVPQFWLGGEDNDHFVIAPGSLATGSWSHVAATVSGMAMTLYVNGIAVGSGTFPGGDDRLTHISGNVAIGRFSDIFPQHWNGGLDDLRIYDRALSAGEITALYNDEGCQ